MSKISELVIRDQLSNAPDVYKLNEPRSELNAYQERELAAMIDRLVQEGKAEQATTWASEAAKQQLATELLESVALTDD